MLPFIVLAANSAASEGFSYLGIVTTVVSFVLLVCTVVVTAYAGLTRETLKTVRENNTDLVQRVGILEGAETRLTAELETERAARGADRDAANAQYDALRMENDVLKNALQYPEQLSRIESLLNEHHTEALTWWNTVSQRLGDSDA